MQTKSPYRGRSVARAVELATACSFKYSGSNPANSFTRPALPLDSQSVFGLDLLGQLRPVIKINPPPHFMCDYACFGWYRSCTIESENSGGQKRWDFARLGSENGYERP